MNKIKILILFFTFTYSLVVAQGQGSSGVTDAVSSGMGNTYTSNIYGVYAIDKNPANIYLGDQFYLEIATVLPFPNMMFIGGTNILTVEDYNYYFGGVEGNNGSTIGRLLTDQDKQNLMDLFSDGGKVFTDISINYLTLVVNVNKEVGSFGISIKDKASFFANLPDGIINLALNGNPKGEVFSFNDTELQAWWIRDYSISYAKHFDEIISGIDEINFGISLKYIQGFALVNSEHVKTSITTGDKNEITADGDILAYSSFSSDFGIDYDFDDRPKEDNEFSFFPTPAGTGFGIDLGVNFKFDKVWDFAIAITDIGSINWTENVAEYSSSQALLIDDLSDRDKLDSLLNTVTGEGKFIGSRKTGLPTAFRFGFTYDLTNSPMIESFPGDMKISLDYNQGFNNLAGNSTKPRLSLGAQWAPAPIIPIRTGFTFGGRNGFGWSFGAGLDLDEVKFDFSASNFANWLNANNSQSVTFAFGSRLKF